MKTQRYRVYSLEEDGNVIRPLWDTNSLETALTEHAFLVSCGRYAEIRIYDFKENREVSTDVPAPEVNTFEQLYKQTEKQ